MAKAANAANVAADMRPPNFRSAVQLLRGIDKKKEKIAGVTAEIGDIFAKVEGHKVNKKAARMFVTLDNLEPEDRVDIMRSLNGLIDAAGWEETAADLVDKAEGNVVAMRAGFSRPDGEDGDEGEDGDDTGENDAADAADFEEASDEELAQQTMRKQPYTGDNADLVDDDSDLAGEDAE